MEMDKIALYLLLVARSLHKTQFSSLSQEKIMDSHFWIFLGI